MASSGSLLVLFGTA